MKGPCKTPGCASHAINPHRHGRKPDVDLDLCDVCYWRKRAIDWRKWPDKKPGKGGVYLINAKGDFVSIGDYDPKYEYWVANEEMVDVTHWAEIPRPEGEETA
jgi:hypothetical protein